MSSAKGCASDSRTRREAAASIYESGALPIARYRASWTVLSVPRNRSLWRFVSKSRLFSRHAYARPALGFSLRDRSQAGCRGRSHCGRRAGGFLAVALQKAADWCSKRCPKGRKMAANQTCCDVSLVLASSALRCLRIRDRALRVEWTALFGCLVSRFRIRVTAVWSLAAAAFAVCQRRTALHGRRQGRMPRLRCGSLGKYRCCLRGGRVSAAHAAAVAIVRELVFARKADQGCACRAAQFEGERTWR